MDKFSGFCFLEHFQKQLSHRHKTVSKKYTKKVPKAASSVLLPLALTILSVEWHNNFTLKTAPSAKMFLCFLKDWVVLGRGEGVIWSFQWSLVFLVWLGYCTLAIASVSRNMGSEVRKSKLPLWLHHRPRMVCADLETAP